jgi:hypothetical protein
MPDGRIFGQITQEAPKNCLWPEKIGQIWQKVADKRPENIFYNYLNEKSYIYL